MAGEWIPVDCCLWEKLEVLRISKATGCSTNERCRKSRSGLTALS